MLEARIKLKYAIQDEAPIEEINELFIKYCQVYDKVKHPNEHTRTKHAKIFIDYLDYINGVEEEDNNGSS